VGADLWETDVTVTSDEKLILMHDTRLLRTTNIAQCYPLRKEKAVHQFTLAEIRRLDAGSWFIDQDPFGQIAARALTTDQVNACKKERIPTVEEALIFTKERCWRINLELKSLPVELNKFPMVSKILNLIDRIAMAPNQVIISSFQHHWLREIATRRPTLPIQALIGDTIAVSMQWGNFEFETYNANHKLIDVAQIRKAHDYGKKINIFTVNEVSLMVYYKMMGVAGLFTDFPQKLSTLL
jgi:glycerophosphoryl diester phosphodiesterase